MRPCVTDVSVAEQIVRADRFGRSNLGSEKPEKAIRNYRRGTIRRIAKLVRLGCRSEGYSTPAPTWPLCKRKMVGHESVMTTAGYDRRGDLAKRKAAYVVHVPFFPLQA
jgi:hypothetical protein